MSSSKFLSISDLFFTSPSSDTWLLLLLHMLPDQACQMSLIFGLSLTLFCGDISFSHVCMEAFFLLLWSPSLLLKYAWHGDVLAGTDISAELQPSAGLSSSGSPLQVPPGVLVTFYHVHSHKHITWFSVLPPCPSLRMWFPITGTVPTKHRNTLGWMCPNVSHHIPFSASLTKLEERSLLLPGVPWGKQSHGEMDLLPHCCMRSMWQSRESHADLPAA